MRFLFTILSLFLYLDHVYSEIIHINKFDKVIEYVDKDTLILLDVDQTLIESSWLIGNTHWNHYMRQTIDSVMPGTDLYGWITYWIACHVPVKPVEKEIPAIVREWQSTNQVMGFTARGEANWNYSPLPAIDLFTRQQLHSVGIFLEHPAQFDGLQGVSNGAIFTAQKRKGPFLKNLLEQVNPRPKRIVFVDDNIQQLESVEEAMKTVPDISFLGCYYTYSEDNADCLDIALGTAQLQALFGDKMLQSELTLKDLIQHFVDNIMPLFYDAELIKSSTRDAVGGF